MPAVQHLLVENRHTFRQHGVLVPQSGQAANGSHTKLVQALAGLAVSPEHAKTQSGLAQEIDNAGLETVLISSEFLAEALMTPALAQRMSQSLRTFGLEPTILLYVSNQPQLFNTSYSLAVKACKQAAPFQRYVHRRLENPAKFDYSRWLDIGTACAAELKVRPYFAGKPAVAVEDFLATIGVPSPDGFNQSGDGDEATGPFTVGLARELIKRTGHVSKPAQSAQLRRLLRGVLATVAIEEPPYCGLDTGLASRVEEVYASRNDRVATSAWGRTWAEMFSADTGCDFKPNDYDIAGMPDQQRDSWEKALATLQAHVDGRRTPRASAEGLAVQAAPGREKRINGQARPERQRTKSGGRVANPLLHRVTQAVGRELNRLTGAPILERRWPLHADNFPMILMFCQKAGCTTLTKWFLYHTGKLDEALAYHPWVHRYRSEVLLQQPGYKSQSQSLVQSRARPVVKLVRNPYHRAVSSFLHTVENAKPSGRSWPHELIKAAKIRAGKPVSGADSRPSLSFLDFMRHVSATGVGLDQINGHVAQQFMSVERHIEPRIVKLEQFEEEMRRIEDEYGLSHAPIELISSSAHHKRKAPVSKSERGSATTLEITRSAIRAKQVPAYEAFYDEETTDLVRACFAEDFEAYGYAT